MELFRCSKHSKHVLTRGNVLHGARIFGCLQAALSVFLSRNILFAQYSMELFVDSIPSTWCEFRDQVADFFKGGLYDTKYITRQVRTFAIICRFSLSLRSLLPTPALPLCGGSMLTLPTTQERRAMNDWQVPGPSHASAN